MAATVARGKEREHLLRESVISSKPRSRLSLQAQCPFLSLRFSVVFQSLGK